MNLISCKINQVWQGVFWSLLFFSSPFPFYSMLLQLFLPLFICLFKERWERKKNAKLHIHCDEEFKTIREQCYFYETQTNKNKQKTTNCCYKILQVLYEHWYFFLACMIFLSALCIALQKIFLRCVSSSSYSVHCTEKLKATAM